MFGFHFHDADDNVTANLGAVVTKLKKAWQRHRLGIDKSKSGLGMRLAKDALKYFSGTLQYWITAVKNPIAKYEG